MVSRVKPLARVRALILEADPEMTEQLAKQTQNPVADTDQRGAAAVRDLVVSAKNLITKPVDTLSGAVSGLGVAFRRASDSLTGPKRSDSEESRVKDLIGFSKTKRDYAYQFGVDVYSDNRVLQDALDEISWAGYGGSMTLSAALAAVPGGAGIVVSVVTTNRLLNDLFRTTAPVDLRRMNGETLNGMEVNSEIADSYLNNAVFSPREQTLLVYALDEMKGVGSRAAFVRFAVATPNANIAFFRERQAEMYAGYHKAVAPISSFASLGELAAARTGSGGLVFCAPLDYGVWTEPMAKFITAANKVMTKQDQGKAIVGHRLLSRQRERK